MQLVGDCYVLAGSLVQVFGKMKVARIIRKRQRVSLPAGAKGIERAFSSNHIDILSFFLIGAGFLFLILVDSGISSVSFYLFLPSLILLATGVVLGFGRLKESY